MKQKLKAKLNKHLESLVTVFDQIASEDTYFLQQTTITQCSNAIQAEQSSIFDEQIKAKVLSRLVREYRRSLEQAKLQKQQEEREARIEAEISKKFPDLISQGHQFSHRNQNSPLRYNPIS